MLRSSERREPLYYVIERDLLAKIERGTWPINGKLPSEDELQKQYKVSRGTVRRALYDLESEGYITRMPGKGTFVTRVTPKIERPLGEITSFTHQLSRAGFRPTTRVLFAGVIKASEADGRVEKGFGIPADAEVIHIKRLREGNGMPFAIQSVYLRPELCQGILKEDLVHLFNVYEEKYGCRIATADEIIQVSGASTDESELLRIDPGTPVVIRDRVSYGQDGTPFEVLYSVDRGDRYAYRYMILTDSTEVVKASERDLSPRGFERR